jgi:hypothetical protein
MISRANLRPLIMVNFDRLCHARALFFALR